VNLDGMGGDIYGPAGNRRSDLVIVSKCGENACLIDAHSHHGVFRIDCARLCAGCGG
jgi:hypothetical protein